MAGRASGVGFDKKVLIFTHRPILAGLVAASASITNAEEIQKILDAKELVGKGFRVFNCDGSNLIFSGTGNLTLEV